ncbi:hypothetical protein E6C67_14170 [Azospirillum sp. TSA2s]|uniref:hypothetical protein n=1 Tax=Azospirillum sp. TSA2s TaxID=709810 RepID=UPI0010AA57DF|nr:hypothetical protein [Azospirillum sp. TSA2s]QCG94975.1 hypothetical protein E6C67_14170 [Azospirillum sp. TSA2s]
MTIICAMHEPGVGTWIGSDQRVTAGNVIVSDCTPKWALVDGGAIAVSGSNAVRTTVFDRSSEINVCWSASELRKWLMSIWEDLGVPAKIEDGEAAYFRGGTILASPHRILPLCSAFGASTVPDRALYAAGSGCDFAEGAAFTMRSAGLTDARTIMLAAIRAAVHGNTGCGGEPFVHLLAE